MPPDGSLKAPFQRRGPGRVGPEIQIKRIREILGCMRKMTGTSELIVLKELPGATPATPGLPGRTSREGAD